MDTHTHLLILGTGEDREEIRLWEEESVLADRHGVERAGWDDYYGVWVVDSDTVKGTTWTIAEVV